MDTLLQFFSLSLADQKRVRELHKRLIRLGVNSDAVLSEIISQRSQMSRYRAEHSREVRAEAVRANWK